MKIISMDNRTIIYKLATVMAIAVTLQSCKPKINEIDNNQVISKPYSLYVCDSVGTIYNTNEGYNYEVIVNGGGIPSYAIITSGNNLVFIERSAHIVENSQTGRDRNPTYGLVNPLAFGQSAIINVPNWNRIYIASLGTPKGMSYNDSNGKAGSWRDVTDVSLPSGIIITSFTQLDNGRVISFDNVNRETYKLDNPSQQWQKTTGTKLPATGQYFLSHIYNTVIAVDTTGVNGAFYSSNDGNSWDAYTGLPNTRLYCANAPFDQTILVGTENSGVYRLPLGTTKFMPANIGMAANADVLSIVGKYDYYKNKRTKQYVYAATDKGIYRSEDFGENWVLVWKGFDGNGKFTAMY